MGVEDEEAITGGLQIEGLVKPGDGLVVGGQRPVIERVDFVVAAGDDREGGLVVVVGEEEVAGGGGEAPGVTDGAASEEGFGGQADEDLPYHDLIREATVERLSSRCT
jgi:hypothetical protein